MLTNEQICNQLSLMYPDFGQCDENLSVSWDKANRAWVVDFVYDGNKIRHFLEDEDASNCINEDRCLGMGIEFAQFR